MNHKIVSAIATAVAIVGGTAITSCAQPIKYTQSNNAAASTVTTEAEESARKTAEKDMHEEPSFDVSYDDTDRTITVLGSAKTVAAPDRAQIELGLDSDTQRTATKAQDVVADKIDAVKGVLKSLGVEDSNVTCSQYSLTPVYNTKSILSDSIDSDTQKITGYESTAVITIENVPLECVSEYISETTDAGADSIADISYTTIEYDEIYNKTLKAALDNARAKADMLAKAENAKVGKAVSIDEGYQDASARTISATLMDTSTGTAKNAPEIDPENLEINATVSVTYNIDY